MLIYRCLMESGLSIGSVDDVWSDSRAWRSLGTWRMCIDAITELIGGNHGVKASFIKACVMQTDGLGSVPYALEEVADFLVTDTLARLYWQSMVPDGDYPHKCPHCNSAAFIGFLQVDCKARCAASQPRDV